MASFLLPKWLLNRLDTIRRSFLWRKNEPGNSGISLLNWGSVCLPRQWGGFGISQLELKNVTLLLRWWWRLYAQPDSLWSRTVSKLRRRGSRQNGPCIWTISGSFFWRQLGTIKHLFTWSTTWIIRDGTSISFWHDAWAGNLITNTITEEGRLMHLNISLREAASLALFLPNEVRGAIPTHFSNQPDQLIWHWGSKGTYSASSVYKVMAGAGKIGWPFMELWSCKAPPSVKLFLLLLLRDKLLTHDVMRRRGFNCNMGCVLCNSCPGESALHLLFLCPYATHV